MQSHQREVWLRVEYSCKQWSSTATSSIFISISLESKSVSEFSQVSTIDQQTE
jgi:hypothetical protein